VAKKTSQAAVKFPLDYPRSMFANRVSVEQGTGFSVAHFGLVTESGVLLDRFSCVFTGRSLAENRENLVAYSDRIGEAKKALSPWVPPPPAGPVPIVDFMHASHFGATGEAEMCFCNIAHGPSADALRNGELKGTVPVSGLIIIRCEFDLQKGFLEALYPA
jgi:hypothetical protein